MKWSNLKKRIIDFFYKEIEMKDENEQQSTHIPLYGKEKHHLSALEEESKDVKIRYQYPKQKTGSFRFPVIPDDITQASDTHNLPNERVEQKQKKATVHRRSSSKNRPEELTSRKIKTFTRELDEVPAFRRRGGLQHENRTTENEEIQATDEAKTRQPKEILPHTKPEELDAVFKKRDGKLQQKEENAPTLPLKTVEPVDEKENSAQEEVFQKTPAAVNVSRKKESLNKAQEEIAAGVPFDTEDVQVKETISEEISTSPPISEAKREESARGDFTQQVSKETVKVEQEVTPIPDYLLNDHPDGSTIDEDWLLEQQILLEDTFTHFNINATVVNVTQGPSVTRFEIQPALGVKVSKIKNLSDDLKLNLAAKDIRIEAPIPGRNTIGIEIPNKTTHVVNLQELLEAEKFKDAASSLTIALGLTIEGEPIITNIDKMPHGLIAGATGSGKSVCINTIILSLLYKAHHNDVKLLLVDPKMVELTPYNNIPHLIAPVITDVKAATKALKWAVDEMEDRYHKFVELGVRNIQKFNEKVEQGHTSYERMSYIVIIIDELADLMMVSPQEVEDAICRIAQKARACGIHLLLATQRPSVDVITGLIKANIPTRIAFSVSSQVDSRTMLDTNGAEKLLGKGDMLFVENGAGKAIRLQGPFVSDEEIERVASYVRSIAEPEYLFEEEQLLTYTEEEDEDELLEDVITFVVSNGQASTSLLQRQFRIGYNRAARLIDSLEAKGIISGQNGSKPREVFVTEEQVEYI